MSRKAKEVSSSGRGGGADTVVDVATVEFRFGAVVLIEKLVFDKIYETIGVAEYHFALLKAINFSTPHFLPHDSGVIFPWMFSSIHQFHLHNDKTKDQSVY